MKLDSQRMTNWLVSIAIVLGLLVVGRPLLVPFLFAVLLWSILNTLTDRLQRTGIPRLLSWFASFAAIGAALYLIVRILANEAAALANRGPTYVAKLEALFSQWFSFLGLGAAPNPADLFSRNDVTAMLSTTAASAGDVAFQFILVAIYLGFLISEQRYLPAKLGNLIVDDARRDEGRDVIRTIAAQVQSYLGVCTLLSTAMAAISYAVLRLLGVEFAGFWALVMFLLTYIPTVGALGVLLPALMALVQFGSVEIFLLVAIALGAAHFVLANIVQTILLGRSLNMSALAIIVALGFWGLIWGVAGLFLAVPIMAAIAIVCRHIDGAHWVSVLLAGPPLKQRA